MRTIRALAFVFLISSSLLAQEPITLAHPITGSDTYRLISINDQRISLNDVFVRDAQIVTRVEIHRRPFDERRAAYDALFYLTESTRSARDPVPVTERYPSSFLRDGAGRMEIDPAYIMPVTRNFPVFPDNQVDHGATWSARAWELHDLSEGYAIAEPISFEMPVSYRYAGSEQRNGRELHRIEAEYNVFHRRDYLAPLYPQQIVGRSEQTIWWDQIAGRIDRIEEDYLIQFFLNDGQTITYEGRAVTTTESARPLDRGVVGRLQAEIDRDGIADTEVRNEEDGISISLQNIAFPPDSARILPEEQRRLAYIAEILQRYPDNEVLITGHTALAGSAEGRRILSIERARAVGRYLIDQGVRAPADVYYRGLGATEPIGDNGTDAGRRQNRRVEIQILDN